MAAVEKHANVLPICECGAGGCRDVRLPADAWEAAGGHGDGCGPGGRDIFAIAIGHVRAYHEVLEEHRGWIAVIERGAAG